MASTGAGENSLAAAHMALTSRPLVRTVRRRTMRPRRHGADRRAQGGAAEAAFAAPRSGPRPGAEIDMRASSGSRRAAARAGWDGGGHRRVTTPPPLFGAGLRAAKVDATSCRCPKPVHRPAWWTSPTTPCRGRSSRGSPGPCARWARRTCGTPTRPPSGSTSGCPPPFRSRPSWRCADGSQLRRAAGRGEPRLRARSARGRSRATLAEPPRTLPRRRHARRARRPQRHPDRAPALADAAAPRARHELVAAKAGGCAALRSLEALPGAATSPAGAGREFHFSSRVDVVTARTPPPRRKGICMPGTYKKIELVGTSPVSFAEAVKTAIEEASKSVRHMNWFEVVEERGYVKDGKVAEFQVTVSVGFKIE